MHILDLIKELQTLAKFHPTARVVNGAEVDEHGTPDPLPVSSVSYESKTNTVIIDQ